MLKNTGSILIVISQTRDKIDAVTFGEKKTRAGGRALRFYAHVEYWTAIVERKKKEVGGEKIVAQQKTRCRIQKNRLTGNECDVGLTILKNYGVDDIGDNIDYLVQHRHWKKKDKKVVCPEFGDKSFTRAGLIQYVEDEGLENDLASFVQEVWADLQEKAKPKRKPRYGQKE
jgi:hypothetical protein